MSVDWWAIAGALAITAASAGATLHVNRLQRRDQARHDRRDERAMWGDVARAQLAALKMRQQP